MLWYFRKFYIKYARRNRIIAVLFRKVLYTVNAVNSLYIGQFQYQVVKVSRVMNIKVNRTLEDTIPYTEIDIGHIYLQLG